MIYLFSSICIFSSCFSLFLFFFSSCLALLVLFLILFFLFFFALPPLPSCFLSLPSASLAWKQKKEEKEGKKERRKRKEGKKEEKGRKARNEIKERQKERKAEKERERKKGRQTLEMLSFRASYPFSMAKAQVLSQERPKHKIILALPLWKVLYQAPSRSGGLCQFKVEALKLESSVLQGCL